MPRFQCLNQECSEYEKEVFFCKLNYRYDKEKGELVPSENLNCVGCGQELSVKKKKGFPQHLKIGSLSPEERKKVVHKRAQDHFNKVGREQKESIKKETIKRYMK